MRGNVEISETTKKAKKNNNQDNNSTHTLLTGVNIVDNAIHPQQVNELDEALVNTILTDMTMQAEKSDNGLKYQDEGNLTDNHSIAGMTIGEKEINDESNSLANVVEKTNNLTLMAQKPNESDNQTVLSGLTIDDPHINKNQEPDQGVMDSISNKPDFHQGRAN
eukprot:2801945-Ditylum_brightwellii.AAC.1